jgi:hypothetical protein
MRDDFRNHYQMTVTDEAAREMGFKSVEDIVQEKDKMKELSSIIKRMADGAEDGQSEESSGPAGVSGNKDDKDENDGFAGDFAKNIRAKRSLWAAV